MMFRYRFSCIVSISILFIPQERKQEGMYVDKPKCYGSDVKFIFACAIFKIQIPTAGQGVLYFDCS